MNKTLRIVTLGILSAATLSACTGRMYSPSMRTHSMLNPNKSELSVGMVTEQYPMGEISTSAINRLAHDYQNRGEGPATIMVLYNNGECPIASKKLASKQGDMIRQQMKNQGAGDVRVHVSPVDDNKGNRAIISYPAMNVVAPKGCGLRMPGMVDRTMIVEDRYRLGCENERLLGQMVASPRDLTGQTDLGAGTSQRQRASADAYNAGENTFSGNSTGSISTGATD